MNDHGHGGDVGSEVDAALTALTSAVDALLAVSFTAVPARALPEMARAVETQLRRVPVFEHALIARSTAVASPPRSAPGHCRVGAWRGADQPR